MLIKVGARSSPLSLAQVEEVLREIRGFFPKAAFDVIPLLSQGDKDKKTSLRTMGKTDFFTKEIDDLILAHTCRIGIHSAKDLPEPLAKGLKRIALTKGEDSSDSLVLRQGDSLEKLPKGACIATSSERREEAVLQLRPDFAFTDIRGTIHERLEKLENGSVHGVVIAEAALIRLKLTHLNRIKVPGETVPFQGRLAIIAREDDTEMETLFACLDYP